MILLKSGVLAACGAVMLTAVGCTHRNAALADAGVACVLCRACGRMCAPVRVLFSSIRLAQQQQCCGCGAFLACGTLLIKKLFDEE